MSINSLYDSKLKKDIYHPKIVAYYFREWKDFNMPFHRHDQVEIMYVLKGKCTVETSKEKLLLAKGDCIVLDANVSHNLLVEVGKPCKMLNIEFIFVKEKDGLLSIRELIERVDSLNILFNSGTTDIILKDTDEIYEVMKKLIRELDEKSADSEYITKFLFYELLIAVGRKVAENISEEKLAGSLYVKKAIRYINENYSNRIHVDDVASSVNLHPNYLQRIFKVQTGKTIMEYLQEVRLRKAEMLLAYTDIPIIDMAEELGYGGRQYFSFIFKKCTGLSPAEFRKINSQIY